MDITIPGDRETIAKCLEAAAAKLRKAEGIPINIEMKQERPMLIDDELMRMRHTGTYRFRCDLQIQFPAGDWISYGEGTETDETK